MRGMQQCINARFNIFTSITSTLVEIASNTVNGTLQCTYAFLVLMLSMMGLEAHRKLSDVAEAFH